MLKKDKYNSFEEIFEEYFADILIDTDYDLYKTSDGNYYCRNCTTKVQRFQKCSTCKKNIDWKKILIGDDLEYQCPKCNSRIPRFQNCPSCNKNIDWRKRIIGIEWLILELVKGDKSAIANSKVNKEFYDRVKNMPDHELMSFHEGLYNNLEKQDVELIKASNNEVRRRYLEADDAWKRIFSEKRYQEWHNLVNRVELKAQEFAIEKIQRRK